jgi:hypothetical protein
MKRAVSLSVLGAVFAVPLSLACSDTTGDDPGESGGSSGVAATGGTVAGASGTSGTATSGGATSGGSTSGGAGAGGSGNGGATSGGAPPTGGTAGTPAAGGAMTGGSAGEPVAGSAGVGAGGASGGAGGASGGAAGAGVAGSFVGGGAGGTPTVEPLDCGEMVTALENNGPPANRMNYVIVGDGYSQSDLAEGGVLDQHMEAMLEKRFSDPVGQPYLRYRKFINICVMRVPSGSICGSSEFGCCGDDGSRLASCNNTAVNNFIRDNVPASFEVDLRAVVLNGDSWWNSGGTLMMWSGGNNDAGGAALHEGGHGFHSLSDEYGNCEQGRVSREATYGVNVSLMNDSSGDKWDGWLDYNHEPGTGMQGFFACDGGQTWRPTQNSMMNSLFGNNPNTSYNPVSREKIVMDIWRVVQTPYDSVTPEPGPVTNPAALTVNVIDPEVISVDWTVDGNVVAMDGGPTYNIGAANLAPGTHMVTARAYDNAGPDLVRQVPGTTFNRQYWGSGAMGHSDKTVSWTVTIQ